MAVDPITAIIDAGKTVIGKIWGDKAGEAELIQLEQQFELELRREATKESSSFRKFIVEYEGAAKDMPVLIQYLRSMIRPCFTILVGWLDWMYFSQDAMWAMDKVALLKAINVIILFFWFGERAVTNSGVVGLLKGRGKE